jgi:putative endonuclease
MYIGVTNDLKRRIYEHQNEIVPGFTKRYHIHKCVYYEEYNNIDDAIYREKQLKSWRRDKKNSLINLKNSQWSSLNELILNQFTFL